MIQAKGKKKRKELEADAEALKKADERIKVVESRKAEKQSVSAGELQNVVKGTFDRLFQEFFPEMGEKERELYARERAYVTLLTIKVKQGAKIKEVEQEVPLCRNCR